jgi:hypothetical protein
MSARARPLSGRNPSLASLGLHGKSEEGGLQFVNLLSEQSLRNIEVFDSLAKGLDMTLEDFFNFINRLLEEGVPDDEDEDEDDE